MKKIISIMVLLLLVFSIAPVETYAKHGGITPNVIDGPCPYHLGDHRLQFRGLAIIENVSLQVGWRFYRCDCGYDFIASGFPHATPAGQIQYYLLDGEFYLTGGGSLDTTEFKEFEKVSGVNVKWTDATTLPGMRFTS